MDHPWFTSRPSKTAIKIEASPFEADTLEQGYPDDYPLENDLLDTLRLLGWHDQESLKKALCSKGKNAEKVFYNLLHKRKWDMLENYNNDEPQKYDVEGGAVRRADSFASDVGSLDNLALGKRSPTILKEGDIILLMIDTRRVVSESAAGSPRGKTIKFNSPLSTANTATDEGSTSAKDIVLKDPEITIRDPETVKIPTKPKYSVRKGILAINTSEIQREPETQKSPGIGQAIAALTVSTPKFHRRGLLLPDPVPQSPVLSSTPKTSWFQGLFSFKPEMYYLISSRQMDETTQLLQLTLNVRMETNGSKTW